MPIGSQPFAIQESLAKAWISIFKQQASQGVECILV